MLNKGKIVSAARQNVTGQLVTSVGLWVTADMRPSFRVVAFYTIPWSGLEELVSDSVWTDVVDGCVGGVSGLHLLFKYKPNDSVPLDTSATIGCIKWQKSTEISIAIFKAVLFLLCFCAADSFNRLCKAPLHTREKLPLQDPRGPGVKGQPGGCGQFCVSPQRGATHPEKGMSLFLFTH